MKSEEHESPRHRRGGLHRLAHGEDAARDGRRGRGARRSFDRVSRRGAGGRIRARQRRIPLAARRAVLGAALRRGHALRLVLPGRRVGGAAREVLPQQPRERAGPSRCHGRASHTALCVLLVRCGVRRAALYADRRAPSARAGESLRPHQARAGGGARRLRARARAAIREPALLQCRGRRPLGAAGRAPRARDAPDSARPARRRRAAHGAARPRHRLRHARRCAR